VARLVVDRAREKENTSLLYQLLAKPLNITGQLEASKTDGAGVGRSPIKDIGMAGEECRKPPKIGENNLEIAVDKFLAMAKSESGEKFAGGTGADGRVVLERDDSLQEILIMRSEPGETQAGEAVGLADRAET